MTIFRAPALSLFRTSMLRDAPIVRDMCGTLDEVFATRDMTSRGHFTSYFRVITLRPETWYPNPVLADMYLLHELTHITLPYCDPSASWLDWVRSRVASEFQASLLTECLIYFHIPQLRELTFDHEIWVDRFLHLRGRPLHAIEVQIADERRRALNAPRYDDFIEFQIHGYGAQNMRWCRIWGDAVGYGPDALAPAFRVVERHLSAVGWEERHGHWLDEHSEAGVPFAHQAAEFERAYDETLAAWGNQYLKR